MSTPTRRPWLFLVATVAAIASVASLSPAIVRALQSDDLLERMKPDLVLVNGKFVTVDRDFSIAQAVAIKDGRIVAVGADADVRALAGRHTTVTDLEGRTVLPGFIDPHVHFAHKVGKVEDPYEDMFAEATSIEAVRKAVATKVQHTDPGELIWFSRGASRVDKLSEKRWPTRHDLDAISPDNPVILGFASDHTTVVNSAALKRAGITKDTPQPTERGLTGEIVKDPDTGEPTGVLIEKGATTLVRNVFDMYSTEVLEENIKRGFERVLAYGITSLYDPMSNAGKALDNKPGMLAYQRLARLGEMKVRVNNMIRLPIRVEPEAEVLRFLDSLLYVSLGNDFLRVGTLKIAVDGSGYLVPRDTVRNVLKAAHRAGWQMFIHVSAEPSFEVVTDALDEAYREFPRQDARHVITHARNPSAKDLAVLKRWGIMVEPQAPGKMRTYLDNGIVAMTGTDQKPIGPLLTIWSSVTQKRDDGSVADLAERISLEEAIRAVTITPAWGSFEEGVKGSIEVGKVADLVVLGRDIMTVPAEEIRNIPVLMTMVGGKWMYVNPSKDPNQKIQYLYWG